MPLKPFTTPQPPAPASASSESKGLFPPTSFSFLQPPSTPTNNNDDGRVDITTFQPLWTPISSCEAGTIVRLVTPVQELNSRIVIVIHPPSGRKEDSGRAYAQGLCVYRDYSGKQGRDHWRVVAAETGAGAGGADGEASLSADGGEKAIAVYVEPQWESEVGNDAGSFGIWPNMTVNVGHFWHAHGTAMGQVIGRAEEKSLVKLRACAASAFVDLILGSPTLLEWQSRGI